MSMDDDSLLVALTMLGRLKSVSSGAYALRLRLAKKALDAIDQVIEETVTDAIDKTRPGHLTWEQIGHTLELSKSGVYAKYGKRK